MALWRGLNTLHVKHLGHCLVHGKLSVKVSDVLWTLVITPLSHLHLGQAPRTSSAAYPFHTRLVSWPKPFILLTYLFLSTTPRALRLVKFHILHLGVTQPLGIHLG